MRPSPRLLPAALAAALLCACAGNSRFHPPQTDAEKALDNILKINNGAKKSMFFSMLKGQPEYDLVLAAKYTPLFTPALLDAWSKEEWREVKEDCGGVFKPGEVCDSGIDFISCSQDNGDGVYIFHTLSSSSAEASIIYTRPGAIYGSRPYRMVKKDGHWQLDGNDCGYWLQFNLK